MEGIILKIIGRAIAELRQHVNILTSESDLFALDGGRASTSYEEEITIDGGNA